MVLAGFFLLVVALLPANLILGLWVVPRVKEMAAAQKETVAGLERLQEMVNLTYFSIDPDRGGLEAALDHLRFWSARKASSSHPMDQETARERMALAEKALAALGTGILPRLHQETLTREGGGGAKYYRRALLRIMGRLDRQAAATTARRLLEDPTFSPQSRIFAAQELLRTSRSQGVESLRELVLGYDHHSMARGYPEMVGLYLNQTRDPARGRVIVELLTRRESMDDNTLGTLIKGARNLEPEDPRRDRVADLLALLFQRRELMGNFRASLLIKNLVESHLKEILRTLKEIMPHKRFRRFLAGIEVLPGGSEGFRRLLEKTRREAGL